MSIWLLLSGWIMSSILLTLYIIAKVKLCISEKNANTIETRNTRKNAKEPQSKGEIIYRIKTRDRARLVAMGKMKRHDGKIVAHLKYIEDNNDPSWIKYIKIMSFEDYTKWKNSPVYVEPKIIYKGIKK